MRAVADEVTRDAPAAPTLERAIAELNAAGFSVEYLELRDAETLSPLGDTKSRPARLLAAAQLGRTRLIDNVSI
jgi:pantoate--beta-alanine ligase